MNHETIFRKFDVMDIPKGSIVLLCGVQNCGKSTWSKKHFKEECIINTDDVFYSILEKYSPAEKTFEEIEMLTSLEIKRLIDESKTKNEYTVVDAVPTEYEERISWIEDFCTEFKNVILIAFKSNILEVLSNPTTRLYRHSEPRSVTRDKKRHNRNRSDWHVYSHNRKQKLNKV